MVAVNVETEKRIPQLDGIRGIAIIQVLIWHYATGAWDMDNVIATPPPHSLPALMLRSVSFTWSGVDLFFVLSGFLIGGILIDNRKASNYFSVFYIRRALRILPLYYLFLTLCLVLSPWSHNWSPPVWSMIALVQNMWIPTGNPVLTGYVWSLCVEEQFYLCLPLLVWFFPGSIRRVCLAAFAGCFLVRCAWLASGAAPHYVHFLFFTRADTLFAGVLCADLFRDVATRQWLSGNLRVLYAALAGTGALIAIMLVENWSVGSTVLSTVGYPVLAAFYGSLLLIAAIETKGPVRTITTLWPLRRMGILAYFLFLFHMFVPIYVFKIAGYVFHSDSAGDWILLGASTVILIGLAELSWRWFEKPLISLGHRIAIYSTDSVRDEATEFIVVPNTPH